MKTQGAPKPCRVCGEPVLHRAGLSTRVHASCRNKEAAKTRAKPVAPATPAYKLTRAVSRHGTTNPNADLARGNHRDRDLLDLAHELHDCTNCGRHVAEGLEPAHENGIEAGKAFGIKGRDNRIAAMCNRCHGFYDQGGVGLDPSGLYSTSAEDKREMWMRAHLRTFDEFWRRGWLRVAA